MNFGMEYHLNRVCGDYNLRRTMEMLGGLSAAREPPSVAFLVAWLNHSGFGDGLRI